MSDTEIFANEIMEHVSRVGADVRKEVAHVRNDVSDLAKDVARLEEKAESGHELYRDMKRRVELLERAEKIAAYERGKMAALGGLSGGAIAAVGLYLKSKMGG